MNTQSLEALLGRIEDRLAKLEKNSHPPVDLTPHIRRIVREMLDDGEARTR